MTIEFHDPRAAPSAPPEPYTPRADLTLPQTIGLLANGFPDSEAFLQAMEVALAAHLPGAQFRHYNKRNASIPANAELVGTIQRECTAAIAAYGH
jgi:hypothetical protein